MQYQAVILILLSGSWQKVCTRNTGTLPNSDKCFPLCQHYLVNCLMMCSMKQRFVIVIHCKTCLLTRVNDTQKQLFSARLQGHSISPTKAALVQINRVIDSKWNPYWTTLSETSIIIFSVDVRKNKKGTCGCRVSQLQGTNICLSHGTCA